MAKRHARHRAGLRGDRHGRARANPVRGLRRRHGAEHQPRARRTRRRQERRVRSPCLRRAHHRRAGCRHRDAATALLDRRPRGHAGPCKRNGSRSRPYAFRRSSQSGARARAGGRRHRPQGSLRDRSREGPADRRRGGCRGGRRVALLHSSRRARRADADPRGVGRAERRAHRRGVTASSRSQPRRARAPDDRDWRHHDLCRARRPDARRTRHAPQSRNAQRARDAGPGLRRCHRRLQHAPGGAGRVDGE